MPWRQLIRMLTQSNPHLIQRLSETGPIRNAARKTVYYFNEFKYKGEEAVEKYKSERSNTGQQGFFARFQQELKEEMKKADQLKKQTGHASDKDLFNQFTKGINDKWQDGSIKRQWKDPTRSDRMNDGSRRGRPKD